MAVDLWTGARLGTNDDAPLGGSAMAEVVVELAPGTCPSFATAADRNTALINWIAAGNTARPGMRAYTVNDGRFWSYNGGSSGTSWQYLPAAAPVFTTLAARDAYFSGPKAPIAGDHCLCLNSQMVHDGTKWRFILSGTVAVNSDSNGFIAIPHGGGQAPIGWDINPGYQANDLLNGIVQILNSSNAGDPTVLGGRVVRTDTNTYIAPSLIQTVWMAQF